jgi:hypothetical protein
MLRGGLPCQTCVVAPRTTLLLAANEAAAASAPNSALGAAVTLAGGGCATFAACTRCYRRGAEARAVVRAAGAAASCRRGHAKAQRSRAFARRRELCPTIPAPPPAAPSPAPLGAGELSSPSLAEARWSSRRRDRQVRAGTGTRTARPSKPAQAPAQAPHCAPRSGPPLCQAAPIKPFAGEGLCVVQPGWVPPRKRVQTEDACRGPARHKTRTDVRRAVPLLS